MSGKKISLRTNAIHILLLLLLLLAHPERAYRMLFLNHVFRVKFPVIVVLVYVATSLMNEDEYNISFRQSRFCISYWNCDSFDSL